MLFFVFLICDKHLHVSYMNLAGLYLLFHIKHTVGMHILPLQRKARN